MSNQDEIFKWCLTYLEYSKSQLERLILLKEEKELLINKVNEFLEEIKNMEEI